MKAIVINEKDNVAVALTPLVRGERIVLPNRSARTERCRFSCGSQFPGGGDLPGESPLPGGGDLPGESPLPGRGDLPGESPLPGGGDLQTGIGLILQEDIPQGHKVALSRIAPGEPVIKYGSPIGHALTEIPAGSWVHTHNLGTNLRGTKDYTYHPDFRELPPVVPEYFMGYLREDSRIAIRNEVWILPLVGCVNGCARALERENQDLVQGSVDGLYAYPHPFGCSQTGEDLVRTGKLLAALAVHPNAAAVLILELGCENLTHRLFLEELKKTGAYDPRRIRFLRCQDCEDELAEGRELLKECVSYAGQFQRTPVPVSRLLVGMKCGGSDGLSGITANPLTGRFCDMLCARGGSAILTEVPEMFGAEEMLFARCRNERVFQKAVDMVNGYKEYFAAHHEVIYENPSPGNKAGGISTLEDKSCGCVQKGGSAPVEDVIGYGDMVRRPGLNLLYGPGNDLVSATALAAAGAHLILFTTGRGTPFGAPIPTLKISTNTGLAVKKAGWIDFNAGILAEDRSMEETAGGLFRLVIQVAEGKKTRAEENGFREISIFKDGVVL